jgi:hypothetical protein
VPTVAFNIGEAFPADDEVGRFVTVLAMMSNDVNRSFEYLDPEGDPERQMTLFRQPGVALLRGRDLHRRDTPPLRRHRELPLGAPSRRS